MQAGGVPCEQADSASLPAVAAHLTARRAPLDYAPAVPIGDGIAIDQRLCAAVDVDGPHRVVDVIAVDVCALGQLEVDSPPPRRDVVPTNNRACRISDSDRAQMIVYLARVDLVLASADDVDPDVPPHSAELTSGNGQAIAAARNHARRRSCSDEDTVSTDHQVTLDLAAENSC